MASKRKQPPAPGSSLVLADLPERNRLRELRALLNERRDQIAELDLEIETVRDALAAFEGAYQARVAVETAALDRIERLVRHYERWVELLQEARPTTVVAKGRKLETRRARELAEQERRKELPAATEVEPEVTRSPDERLKAAYRALARRFHPDLARTEPERIQFGELMARINTLYRDGDLERLEAMAEQAKGGDVDDEEVELAEQVAVLEERLRWFDLVLQNLQEERAALERTPTCELMRNVEQARTTGRDLVDEIRQEMRARVERSYAHVASAARLLESAVDGCNRRNAGGDALTKRQSEALERRFDPFADKRVVRLGLEELRDLHVSPQARELAGRLETELAEKPAVLRLLLLTYVSELSPFPLAGLEGYDDVDLRFAALAGEDEEAPATLDRTLVEADAWVEYGVKRASDKMVWSGLRFHDAVARDAVPVLLKAIPIRREFKKVLSVLGERERCGGCRRDIFAVPLFRTHGLDDLRALVCPRCGHTLRSYWMPKGKDVQAVLNTAFLDFELVSEWSFQLGRGSFGTQLLPLQVEAMKVGELKQRVFADVFERYEVELALEHLSFVQDGAPLADATPLAELDSTTFVVELAAESKLRPAEALEVLRHRVRNRFKA